MNYMTRYHAGRTIATVTYIDHRHVTKVCGGVDTGDAVILDGIDVGTSPYEGVDDGDPAQLARLVERGPARVLDGVYIGVTVQ